MMMWIFLVSNMIVEWNFSLKIYHSTSHKKSSQCKQKKKRNFFCINPIWTEDDSVQHEDIAYTSVIVIFSYYVALL